MKVVARCFALILPLLLGRGFASETTVEACPSLCSASYESAQDRSSVYVYSACFIGCVVKNDEYDSVFRIGSLPILDRNDYINRGTKILAVLDAEDNAREHVACAKVLFITERMKGKLARRQAAIKKLDEYICAHPEDKKNRLGLAGWRCAENGDGESYPATLNPGNALYYVLEKKPGLLTDEQKEVILKAYLTKQDLDYSEKIAEKLLRAAKEKDVGAQFLLYAALEDGIGIDADLVESRAWLDVAVSQNPPKGKQLVERAWMLLNDEQTVEANGRADVLRKNYTDLFKQPAQVLINQ